MARLLGTPVVQLVKDSEVLCATLEPVVDQLSADLRRVLHPVAYLGFFREEVEIAAARDSQSSLRKEIADKCVFLNQQKVYLDDDKATSDLSSKLIDLQKSRTEITKEIQRLQQKLTIIDENIKTASYELEEIKATKQKLKESLSSSLAEVKKLIAHLTPGTNEPDNAIISSVDSIRLKAITAIQQFLHQFDDNTMEQLYFVYAPRLM
ncbi:hypothetical protein BS78_04G131600 [Paspalum vaginatum]|nr:hypothetical protein BS78_04G131600 [Paspalum vaginatum]